MRCSFGKEVASARNRKSSKMPSLHTLRHTSGTLLKAKGKDVAVVQWLMRHANVSVTMDKCVQAVTPAKRRAPRGIVGRLDPNGPTRVARQLASP
jgi:integrase